MLEPEPKKHKQPSKHKRPFPEFSLEEYQKFPELVRKTHIKESLYYSGLWEEKEQIQAEKETVESENIILDRRVKVLEEREHSRFGVAIIQVVLIFLGGILATVGATYILTDPSYGYTLIFAGVIIGLIGALCLLFMKPGGGSK